MTAELGAQWRPIDGNTPRDRPILVVQMTRGDWEYQMEVIRYQEPIGFMGGGGLWPDYWMDLPPLPTTPPDPATGPDEGR